LRRTAPLIEAFDLAENLADPEAGGMPITDFEKSFRDLLCNYGNEYLAFDLGFQFCKFYEIHKQGGSARAENLKLTRDYYASTCHFLKYKTVSPHAMYLIYKALFAA
jgi:hypothetical protein